MKEATTIVGVILLVYLSIMAIIGFGTYTYCQAWGVQSERETRFVNFFPFGFDCVVETEQGWISSSKLQVIETDQQINQ